VQDFAAQMDSYTRTSAITGDKMTFHGKYDIFLKTPQMLL